MSIYSYRVWGEDIPALDCGAQATRWINQYLKRSDCNIVFAAPKLEKRYLVNGTIEPHFTIAAHGSAKV